MRTRERKKAASLSKWASAHPEMPVPPTLPFSDLIDLYVRHGRSATQPHGRFGVEVADVHERERAEYKPSGKEVMSEILHIMRPVAYGEKQHAMCRCFVW